MSQTYDSDHYERIDRIERRHFWFLIRSEILEQVIRTFISSPKGRSFLEIGFGTGIVLRVLDSMGFITTGIDVNARALLYAKKQTRARLLRQSIYTFRPNQQYDAIGAFDVLEHQTQDKTFLLCCKKLLKKQGHLFLTVPAGPYLWSRYDELSGHKKRYTKRDIISILRTCGFRVDYCNYWQVFIVPLYWIVRKYMHMLRPQQHLMDDVYLKIPIWPIHRIMYAIGWVEMKLLPYVVFPFGASLVVVCTKKDSK